MSIDSLIPKAITHQGSASGHGIHSPLVFDFCKEVLSAMKKEKLSQFAQVEKIISQSKSFSAFNIEQISKENIQNILHFYELSILTNDTGDKIFIGENIEENTSLILELFYLNTRHYLITFQSLAFLLSSQKVINSQFFRIW